MDTPVIASAEAIRGYVDYLRDIGVFDLYAVSEPAADAALLAWLETAARTGVGATAKTDSVAAPVIRTNLSPFEQAIARRGERIGLRPAVPGGSRQGAGPTILITPPIVPGRPVVPSAPPGKPMRAVTAGAKTEVEEARAEDPERIVFEEMAAPTSFNSLMPLPAVRVAPGDRSAALARLRAEIGDCTRCPLAYAGRHSIVFGNGDPGARLLFVGEGPGADEDERGEPFVGKAGQLLNNMIGAMGLKREQVFVANVVKCRPPKNRVPEPVEAGTCAPFLLRQIDIVQPEVIVALGGTAATYLLGLKQPLSALRGQWFEVRGAKCAVTYHPAYLLRDPRQKSEAWKDLQRVMGELKLVPPARG